MENNDKQTTQEIKELTPRNLWTYTMTGVGRDAAALLWSNFLNAFVIFTKTLDERQFTVFNGLMIAMRVFDGVTDPIMGNIIEVTRTRFGKFKPWIAIGMVLSAVVMITSFSTRLDGWDFVVFIGVMIFIYSIVFTLNDIGYWGMLPSLAKGKTERDVLASRAALLAGVGAAITTVLVPPLTAGEFAWGGSAVTAYLRFAIVLSAVGMAFQLLTLFGVKEKPLPPKGQGTVNKVSLGVVFRTIKNNDQLSWLILVFLLSTVGANVAMSPLAMNYIYFEFGYDGFLFTLFSALGAAVAAGIMIFYAQISKRITRNQMMRIATFSAIFGYLFMLGVGVLVPSSAGWIKFLLLMLGNLFAFGGGMGVYNIVLMVCVANTVEYNELRTGTRAEGIIFSVRPFVTKLSWAVVQLIVWAVFMLVGVLQHTRRIAGYEIDADLGIISEAVRTANINAVLDSVPFAQSAQLIAYMTLIPIVLVTISYLVYWRKYKITEERYDQILLELKERKEMAAEMVPE